MAMKTKSDGGRHSTNRASASTGFLRRLVVGTNVLVTIGLALVVVLFLNWFAQRYNYRRDLSSLGANRLSERTIRVLDRADEEIRLTAIYTSDEPEKSRHQYLPRIQDLFEEMALHNANLKTEIVHSDDQKRQLEKRVRQAFAAQADEHTQALDKALQLENELTQTLQTQATLLRQLSESGTWIARFTSFTNIAQNIAGLGKVISKTREEVDALTNQALPDYSAANNRVKTAHEQIRTVLNESKTWMEELNKLLVAVSEGRAEIVEGLPARMAELGTLVEALGAAVGAPGDPMPDDPAAALKAYGQAAGELSTYLAGEIARLQNFADEYPVIVEHPNWAIQVSLIGNLGTRVDLPTLLRQEQQNLAGLRPQIVALLSGTPEPNQLRLALERVRNITRDMQTSLKETAEVLQGLPQDLAGVDVATQDLLNADGLTATLTSLNERLDENIKEIEALPELKLGTVGRDLTEDNTIVVEAGDKVKVIRFDDAWPIEHEDVSIPGRRGDIQRAFNGDSSVSAALLTMTEEKPVGAITMTVFEPQIPPQMQRMARPPSGVYPAMFYEQLRQRLQDAHFTVQTWNLAEADAPPELEEEGLARVFLVMPPLEYLVPPIGAQQGMTIPKLDDAKKQLVFDAIGENGRAIFLCNYAPPQSAMMGMFGAGPVSQPRYPYDEYLQTTWGINPQTQYRVFQGIPDPRRPGYWGVSGQSFAYMSMNNFTSHPVGEPFRYRRVPMYNLCPVVHAVETPEGVTVTDILTVPESDDFWGCQNIEDIIRAVLNPQTSGFVQKDLDPSDSFMDILSPFPVIVAAENDKGGRVVVTSQSESVFDGYLSQPIPRSNAKDRISFEPPPTVNAELIVSAAYWVSGREELIGAGPLVTPVIEPLGSSTRTTLSLLVTGWSVLALVLGAMVMFARRK